MEPLREIPGLRRRERTWKDEVLERVRQRRQQRSGGELPLFPEEDEADAEPETEGRTRPVLSDLGEEPSVLARARLRDLEESPALAPDDDLPLRPRDERPFEPREGEAASPLDEELDEPTSDRWQTLDKGPMPVVEAPPPERPARAGERAQAAALDLGLLFGLWSLVVYFASRTAHVTVAGLIPSWRYLVAYLAALGLIYAGYFTGTTGQTLGKIVLGLRVVDSVGRPPGYLRALARAVLGSAGVLAAAAGLVPMAFDPARRALHDRLLKTRVVHI